jgi:transposase
MLYNLIITHLEVFMLPIKKIDKIRSLYFDEGMKIVDISIKLKCSTNTVSKYVKNFDYSPKPKKCSNGLSEKILPYEDDIKELLKKERNGHYKQRLTGKRIYDLLKEKYPDYPCSYSLTVRQFKKIRLEFYSLLKQYVPLIHNPAEAQVDLAEFYYTVEDEKFKGYILTVAFPYSNAFFCQVFKGKSGECFLQGIKNVFLFIEGVPYEITFDNEPSIVHINDSVPRTRIASELFLRFKNHYGFRTYFCNPKSPNEKGNVEVAHRTIRLNILTPMPEIKDFDEFNKQLLIDCEKALNRRRKGIYHTLIKDLFKSDKKNLLPLPEVDFDVATYRKRKCNEMGCVSFKGRHHYYLAPRFVKKIVNVKITATKLYFSDEFFRPLCELERLHDSNTATCVNWGEYFKLLSAKPGAIAKCAIISELPETLREFLLDSDTKTKRKYMQIMHEIYEKEGYAKAIEVANEMANECIS